MEKASEDFATRKLNSVFKILLKHCYNLKEVEEFLKDVKSGPKIKEVICKMYPAYIKHNTKTSIFDVAKSIGWMLDDVSIKRSISILEYNLNNKNQQLKDDETIIKKENERILKAKTIVSENQLVQQKEVNLSLILRGIAGIIGDEKIKYYVYKEFGPDAIIYPGFGEINLGKNKGWASMEQTLKFIKSVMKNISVVKKSSSANSDIEEDYITCL